MCFSLAINARDYQEFLRETLAFSHYFKAVFPLFCFSV